MSKILLNLSNLHVGGGVQVGVSFISELAKSNYDNRKFDLWISNKIYLELSKLKTDLKVFSSVNIVDMYGIRSIFSFKLIYALCFKYKTVFTLFGPLYSIMKPSLSIVGFAQPSILFKTVALGLVDNFFMRRVLRLKLFIQQLFFLKSDIIIVELDTVKERLLEISIFKNKEVFVVNNTYSSIYNQIFLWEEIPFNFDDKKIKLGYLGRNYAHKNTKIFPELIRILRNNYGMDVDIYVTFDENEWSNCTEEFKRVVINVGQLSVSQCPKYYLKLDGVIFPSLLECFSATPLEALIMNRPLFLSDRDFNRSIVKEFGFYFDPLDVHHIARVISNYFNKSNHLSLMLQNSRKYVLDNFDASERMDQYLKIINNAINSRLKH
jgi:glycosyltransferase involved in cell wall biosynthesis